MSTIDWSRYNIYEIDPATKSYVAAGVHHDRLKLGVPFDVDIDLDTLYVPRNR